jgi:hypothetical protein
MRFGVEAMRRTYCPSPTSLPIPAALDGTDGETVLARSMDHSCDNITKQITDGKNQKSDDGRPSGNSDELIEQMPQCDNKTRKLHLNIPNAHVLWQL